jgi:hypothetical protein
MEVVNSGDSWQPGATPLLSGIARLLFGKKSWRSRDRSPVRPTFGTFRRPTQVHG